MCKQKKLENNLRSKLEECKRNGSNLPSRMVGNAKRFLPLEYADMLMSTGKFVPLDVRRNAVEQLEDEGRSVPSWFESHLSKETIARINSKAIAVAA